MVPISCRRPSVSLMSTNASSWATHDFALPSLTRKRLLLHVMKIRVGLLGQVLGVVVHVEQLVPILSLYCHRPYFT